MLFADRLEVMNSGRLPQSLTVDKLRVPHQSLPSNPLLAESMYLLQYIERMGTGTVDMIRSCVEAGLPEPEFEVGAGFLTRIRRPATGTARKQPENSQKTARKRPETNETSQNLTNRILSFLREHPSASRREIAEALADSTEGSIRYQIDKLKAAGKLRRVGPDKGGHWAVIDASSVEANAQTDGGADERRHAGNAPTAVNQKTTRKPPEHDQKTARNEGQSPEPPSLSDSILALLRRNPSVSRREIAATLDTTQSIVRYRLERLREAGKIERVGPDKGGHWKVLGESATEPDQ